MFNFKSVTLTITSFQHKKCTS